MTTTTPEASLGSATHDKSQVLLTARQVQARWNISSQTLWRLQKRKKITAVRPFGNRTTRYDLAEVQRIEQASGSKPDGPEGDNLRS